MTTTHPNNRIHNYQEFILLLLYINSCNYTLQEKTNSDVPKNYFCALWNSALTIMAHNNGTNNIDVEGMTTNIITTLTEVEYGTAKETIIPCKNNSAVKRRRGQECTSY